MHARAQKHKTQNGCISRLSRDAPHTHTRLQSRLQLLRIRGGRACRGGGGGRARVRTRERDRLALKGAPLELLLFFQPVALGLLVTLVDRLEVLRRGTQVRVRVVALLLLGSLRVVVAGLDDFDVGHDARGGLQFVQHDDLVAALVHLLKQHLGQRLPDGLGDVEGVGVDEHDRVERAAVRLEGVEVHVVGGDGRITLEKGAPGRRRGTQGGRYRRPDLE